jgi:cell division septum initiation protein DivIVA
MIESLPEPPELDPAALAAGSFSRARRGFEPAEVHAALGRAADALRTWRLRDAQFRLRLEEFEQRLVEAERLDESRLTEILGAETAKIVAAARDAAAEIRANAEEEAARLLAETTEQAEQAASQLRDEATALRHEAAALRDEAASEAAKLRDEAASESAQLLEEARTESTRLRDEAASESAQLLEEASTEAANLRETAQAEVAKAGEESRARNEQLLAEAESVLAERTNEAEAAAVAIRAVAAEELESARAEAARARDEAGIEADSLREGARDEGRSMVAEARAVRERILRDLVGRRATARRQIEGARAGTDRIIDVLRSTIDEVGTTIEKLSSADEAASIAAADAAGSVLVDTEAELAELLVELGDGGAEPDSEGGSGSSWEVPDGSPAVVGQESQERHPSVDADALGEADDGSSADSDEEAGATVHDLFARIRAEGTDDDTEADPDRDDEETEAPEEPLAAVVGAGDEAVAGPATRSVVAETPASEKPAGRSTAEEGPADDAAVDAESAPVDRTRALLDRRDELLGPVEKSLSRILRRLASDEQNEMLDMLRRGRKGRPDTSTLLPVDRAAAIDRFVESLAPEFERAAQAGATLWAESAGSSVEAVFADDEVLTARLTTMVEGFLDLHRAHLERTFADAEEQGLDATELAERVRATYRDWRSGSLADLAGDLAIAGLAHGQRRAAGPGTPWRWVVDNGGLPCADGEDNSLAGAVACEEPFPTGDITPPAHPGCRCILAPVDR